jgi:hypothetical protein
VARDKAIIEREAFFFINFPFVNHFVLSNRAVAKAGPGSRSLNLSREIHNVAFRRGALEFYVEFPDGEDDLDESRNIVGTGRFRYIAARKSGPRFKKSSLGLQIFVWRSEMRVEACFCLVVSDKQAGIAV